MPQYAKKTLAPLRAVAMTLVIIVMTVLAAPCPGQGQTLRVGVYDNAPIVYQDQDGLNKGLSVEVLEYVAKLEDWTLEYVPGTWPECLKRLRNGEIDIQTYIAYSEARAREFQFTSESLIDNWGVIYAKTDSGIQSIHDLTGGSIALLNGGIHAIAFEKYIRDFKISVDIVNVVSHNVGMKMVADGRVDAIVVNKIFGVAHMHEYGLEGTPIIFNPIEIRYAMPKAADPAIAKAIDTRIKELKANKGSIYYQGVERAFGLSGPQHVPTWLMTALAASLIALAVLAYMSLVLKKEVSRNRVEVERRKLAEHELKDSEGKYRTLAASTSLGVQISDRDGVIVFSNAAHHRILGATDGELIGKHIWDFNKDPSTINDLKEYYAMLFRDQPDPVPFINTNRTLDGREIEIQVDWNYMHDQDGKPHAICCIINDITERNRAERLLRESEGMFRTAVTSAPIIFFRVDAGGVLTMIEGRGLDSFDMDIQKFLHQPIIEKFHDKPLIADALRAALIGEEVAFVAKAMDHWYDTRLSPLCSDDGHVTGAVGVATDITERKLMEEALLEALNEKDLMMKEIHHRIKNNLQVVRSLLSLQSSQLTDKIAKGYFSESENRVRSMAMIHEFLYRSDSFNRMRISDYMDALVNQLIRTCHKEPGDIDLKLDVEDVTLDIDTVIPLGLIVNELVTNSLKHAFTGSTKGKLALGVHSLAEGRYRLMVRDNGPGAPVEPASLTSNPKTLGMKIVTSLVAQIDGRIEILHDNGTEFRIEFMDKGASPPA